MMTVPFLSFDATNALVKQEMLQAFEKVFDSKWYVLGEAVQQFEQAYAAFNQTQYCIGVSNGLDALILCLKTLGVGPGDEVIVPSNTYIATVLAVSHVGATPVFVEPDVHTYNIDVSLIPAKITAATKAIIPVHLYGQACEMVQLMEVANSYGLFVIEDNAQAHGAICNGRLTGNWGHVNATSFYPGKNLGALGDAGAITTNEATYAAAATTLRNYGSNKKYYNEVIGYNMRLDELQAAFLSVKLKYLEDLTAMRIEAARFYDDQLENLEGVQRPVTAPNCSHVYHLYVIRTGQRDALQTYLNERQIVTLIHYPLPPHMQQAYSFLGYKEGDFPVAEDIARTALSLPIYPGMTKEEIRYVCDSIKQFYS